MLVTDRSLPSPRGGPVRLSLHLRESTVNLLDLSVGKLRRGLAEATVTTAYKRFARESVVGLKG
jgi:hypothetical protein